jgi:hypothetical protein
MVILGTVLKNGAEHRYRLSLALTSPSTKLNVNRPAYTKGDCGQDGIKGGIDRSGNVVLPSGKRQKRQTIQ